MSTRSMGLWAIVAVVVIGGGWFVFNQIGGVSQRGTTLEQGDETIGGGTGNAIIDQMMKNPPASGGSESHGSGSVKVNGTPYSFTVSSCLVSSSGNPNMGADGEAKFVLQGRALILNIPALDSQYTVNPFTYEINGQTLTGSGTGVNLAVAGAPKVSVELIATCDLF